MPGSVKTRRFGPFFCIPNLERFHEIFTTHLCQLAGGPCDYTGDSMVDIHVGMDIGEAEFNRVVEILLDAMEAEGIPRTAQNRLLARLAPLREEIIRR
ncbi:MAG: group 1 truncated hemoglobin [Gammaproteobacteria bacterium]|nr:group 1 truncated hemoglobin [Gammaproteobacteria bacterium]